MKTKKTDRRSQRTRRLLGEALISLLQERRYDAITIQDILDRADVGRSTFYGHYWDKEDLISSEIARVIDHLSERVGQDRQHAAPLIPSLVLFQHVQDHRHLYQALLRGEGIEIAVRAFRDHLQEHIEARLREKQAYGIADDVLKAVAFHVAGSFVNLLQWWLEAEPGWSPERVDALFRDLVLPGVQRYLR
jgi:AcrR family transcriptional regulator